MRFVITENFARYVMKDHVKPVALLLLVWALTSLTCLGSPHLWDIDEPRNAGCALEMQQRNDWITPTFNAELRTHKPILLSWAIRASYAAFGVNEFAARFPSAVAGLGTILLTYLIGLRLFDRNVALIAAIALSSTTMFVVASRAATPDSVLMLPMTAALTIFVCNFDFRSAEPAGNAQWVLKWSSCIAMNVLLGLATLAKGPIGFVLPTAVAGLFLLLQTRAVPPACEGDGWRGVVAQAGRQLWSVWNPKHFLLTCWRMRPITSICCITLVALPWFWMVTVATDGAWTRGFFLEHNFGRALSAKEHHGGPIIYYPIALIIGSFPWSIFWIPTFLFTVQVLKSNGSNQRAVQFLACWLGVVLGGFSVAQTKLPSYITPCYPAWCLLIAAFLRSWIVETGEQNLRWVRLAFQSFAGIGVGLAVALPIAAYYFVPGVEWFGLIGIVCLAGGALSLHQLPAGRRIWAVAVHSITAVAFVAIVMGVFAEHIDRHRHIEELMTAADPSNHEIGVFGASLKPSWVFYARKPLQKFSSSQREQAIEFLSQAHNRLIVDRTRLRDLTISPSVRVRIVAEVPGFLGEEPVVIVERASATLAAELPRRLQKSNTQTPELR